MKRKVVLSSNPTSTWQVPRDAYGYQATPVKEKVIRAKLRKTYNRRLESSQPMI